MTLATRPPTRMTWPRHLDGRPVKEGLVVVRGRNSVPVIKEVHKAPPIIVIFFDEVRNLSRASLKAIQFQSHNEVFRPVLDVLSVGTVAINCTIVGDSYGSLCSSTSIDG
jgi:hypothetical protein